MFSKLAIASFVAIVVLLPANAQQTQDRYLQSNYSQRSQQQRSTVVNVGLPQCIHGPAVGQPGDAVSRGNFVGSGHAAPAGNAMNTAGANIGLPKVRTSKFMGQPGDGIRSDMGHQISGQSAYQNRQSAQTPRQVYAPQPKAMVYGDYTHGQ